MALDLSTFLKRFPEFKRTDTELVEAKIAEAITEVPQRVWGDRTDIAAGYLAAHLISTAPGGQQARLIPKNAKPRRDEALTTYEREFKRMMLQVAHGFRIVGD